MKKYVIILGLLLANSITLHAQMLKFGIKAGVNFANYTGGNIDGFDFNGVTSFHGGAMIEFKIFNRFSIQPEVLYSTQGSELKGFGDQIKNELGYISVPVVANIYLLKDRLSLQAGPQFSFLVSERNEVDTGDANSFDFGLAGGLQLKLTENLLLQGRYVAGLTEAKKDADVKNSLIQLSLGYLF